MNRFLATCLFAVFSMAANAAPIVSLGAAGQQTSNFSGVTNVDFNGANCNGYASCSGDFILASGSASGLYAAPAGDLTTYVSVPNPSASSHAATFDLGATANYFGLLWGSIDGYNSISFYLNHALVASFTGTDIVGSSANGNQISYASNAYVNFDFGNSLYDSVKLSSSGFAFESDNHAFRLASSASEPMNLTIFGLGLFSLFAIRRLNKRKP